MRENYAEFETEMDELLSKKSFSYENTSERYCGRGVQLS